MELMERMEQKEEELLVFMPSMSSMVQALDL
jgi:hypothetical protein